MEEIKEIIERHYGISVLKTKRFAGEQDLNIYVKTAQSEYIAKIMHEGCASEHITSQIDVLAHLEKQDLDFSVPQVIPSIQDTKFVQVEYQNSTRILWVLTYCPGLIYADIPNKDSDLHTSLGITIAELTRALKGYSPNYSFEESRWELSNALLSQEYCAFIEGETQELCKKIFLQFENRVSKKLKSLKHSIIHNDANDHNLLVHYTNYKAKVSGIFDFGDLSFQPTICESAICLAYAIMHQKDPLGVCADYLKGFSTIEKIEEEELEVLLDLIKTRLAVSIAISSKRQKDKPDDPYITISQKAAKDALVKLNTISLNYALAVFRNACAYPALSKSKSILDFIKQSKVQPVIANIELHCILDLSVGSTLLGSNPKNLDYKQLDTLILKEMEDANTNMSIGRYAEARMIYKGKLFGENTYPATRRRRIHMGLDVFADAGTKVYAPFDGVVEHIQYNPAPLDYGNLLILRHTIPSGEHFFTLYGHLSSEYLVKEGDSINQGDCIAHLGTADENGNWSPHLHLQIILDLFDYGADVPGVVFAKDIEFWKEIFPNPALLIDPDNIERYDASPKYDEILISRKKQLGHNLSLSYDKPIHAVNGYKQFLYDNNGQGYLDMYNNVPHVGHSHPKVVEAVQKQIGLFNTNTRYLHEKIISYSSKLLSKFPDNFEVCYFLNSASEANELAIRMARAHTKRYDILVNANAYHGHCNMLIDISPYKHDGPGGNGNPKWVHVAPAADDYRGKYKRDNPEAGILYANELASIIENKEIAAYISETYQSVGGQLIPPKNYTKSCYAHIQKNGGVNIADEVQTGFGRLGDAWWGFDSQEALPDIVVLGKPIANGFPMGAVICSRHIAESFNNGMEFFSTFGGNPVACAAAEAVIDVIEEEGLLENARILGRQLKDNLLEMQETYNLIGDVRGQGFFIGIELVTDHIQLTPASAEAKYIVNRLKEHHVLAGTDGPLHNVIKLRPSMATNTEDIAFLCETLNAIFSEINL